MEFSRQESWGPQIGLFAKDFLTVVPDHRGAGRTSFPEHGYTIDQLASDMAESSGVSGYLLKRLLNHITDKSDVTAGYLILTAEELKEPAEKVTETIAKYAGLIEEKPDDQMSEMKSLLASLTKEQKVELMSTLLS